MLQLEHWIATCHVRALEAKARRWQGEADEAIADVVMLARSREELQSQVEATLRTHRLELVWLENIQPIIERFRQQGMRAHLAELARETTPHSPVRFSAFKPILAEAEIQAVLSNEDNVIASPVLYAETNWNELFDHDQNPLWAIVDGVNAREVSQYLAQSEAQSTCLYTSTDPATKAMAPWLVRLEPDSDVLVWLNSLPHDQHWGVLVQSKATLKQLRTHLRKYTMLWTPANEQAPVYFRFYDPRVVLDMVQALDPWKLARFMAPIDNLYAPLSPLMILPEATTLPGPLPLELTEQSCRSRLISITLHDDYRDETEAGRSFSISSVEFNRFGILQKAKANRKLARQFLGIYPQLTPTQAQGAVETAIPLGQRHGMTSVKQIKTLTKCIIEFGDEFPNKYPDAGEILSNPRMQGWRKRNLLEKWIPKGIIRRTLRRKHNILS